MKDLLTILNELNVPYAAHGSSRHVSEGWVGLLCPYCDRGRGNYGLGINLRSCAVACWSCGTHGLADVLAAITGKDVKDIWPLLKTWQRKSSGYQKTPCGKYTPPDGLCPLMNVHREYLEYRRFRIEEIERLWKIQGVNGQSLRAPWSIFIPIIYRGEEVSWTSRSISAIIKQRYTSAAPKEEKYHYKDLLYGEDYCRHAVVVCEGPLDVWRVGPGAACTFGTGYTKAQVRRLAAYPVRVILFDSAGTAQRKAKKLASDLEALPGKTFIVRLSTGKDPAAASLKEIRGLRKRFLD